MENILNDGTNWGVEASKIERNFNKVQEAGSALYESKNMNHLDIRNKVLQQGEPGFNGLYFESRIGIAQTMQDNIDNEPIHSDVLPQYYNLAYTSGNVLELKLVKSGLLSNYTVSFWIERETWNALPYQVLDIYDGSVWAGLSASELDSFDKGSKITKTLNGGGSAIFRCTERTESFLFVVINVSNNQATLNYTRIGKSDTDSVSGAIKFQNIQFFDNPTFIPEPDAVYFAGKSGVRLSAINTTEHEFRGDILSESLGYVISSKQEFSNILYNSGEDGFTQTILSSVASTGTREISEIPIAEDFPFASDILPTMLSNSWTGNASDTKFNITGSILGTGARTFAFWTRSSQLLDAQISSIDIYDGTAWSSLGLASSVGDVKELNVDNFGNCKFERTVNYGDWAMFQLQMADVSLSVLMVRFKYNSDGALHFANVTLANGLVEISPLNIYKKSSKSTVDSIVAEHEQKIIDLSKVNDIVCFGDSLTAGSYPSLLQTALGNSYNVINRGVGGESSLTIAARQGGIPMYISNVTIPEDTTPVVLGTKSASGIRSLYNDGYVTPLLQHPTNDGINNCYVEGIECILKWTGDSYDDETGEFTIERVTPGIEKTTGAKSIVSTKNMRDHLCAIQIIFIGANGGWSNTASELVDQVKGMVSLMDTKRYIVLTSHASNTTQALIDAMLAEFGARYFDLRRYFSTYAIYDAGLTPTQADLDAMALGNCPPQLLNDSIHFNTTGYQMLANQVAQKIKELGY